MYRIDSKMQTVEIQHDAGFFSVLTISLDAILAYYRSEGRLPISLVAEDSFKWYRNKYSTNLFNELFEQNNRREILTTRYPVFTASKEENQFSDYRLIYYNVISQIVNIFFTPSEKIRTIATEILTNIEATEKKILSLVYRGTDKSQETIQPTIDEFIAKSSSIAKSRGISRFFVETDEDALLFRAKKEFGHDNVFHLIRDRQRNYENIVLYFATIYAISMTDHIVSTSGNGEMWVRLFRGHSGNTTQYLCPKEYIYGAKNPAFNNYKHSFWLGSNED
jgi:hypothetical protein